MLLASKVADVIASDVKNRDSFDASASDRVQASSVGWHRKTRSVAAVRSSLGCELGLDTAPSMCWSGRRRYRTALRRRPGAPSCRIDRWHRMHSVAAAVAVVH